MEALQDVRAHRLALYEVLEEIERLTLRNVKATPIQVLTRSRLLIQRIDPALASRLDYPEVTNRTVQEIVFRGEARLIRIRRPKRSRPSAGL